MKETTNTNTGGFFFFAKFEITGSVFVRNPCRQDIFSSNVDQTWGKPIINITQVKLLKFIKFSILRHQKTNNWPFKSLIVQQQCC